jgi:hypothetical protein
VWRKRILKGLLLLILPPLVWVLWLATRYNGLTTQDALHHAQLCRNLAQGQGWTTSVITPRGLQDVPRVEGHPDLWCPPVYVCWQTLFFLVLGAHGKVAAGASGAAWIAMLWLAFAATRHLYGSKPALLVFLVLLLNPYLTDLSIAGLPHTLTAALLVAAFWLFSDAISHEWDADDPPSRRIPWARVAASSLSVSAVALANYNLTFPIIALCLFHWVRWPSRAGANEKLYFERVTRATGDTVRAWIGQRMEPRIFFLVCGVLLFAAGFWMARNAESAGSPLYSLHKYSLMANTKTFPGQSVYRQFELPPTGPAEFLVQHGFQLVRKVVNGLSASFVELIKQVNPVLFALFFIALLRAPSGSDHRLRTNEAVFLGVAFLLTVCLFNQDYASLMVLGPVLTMTAVGELFQWVSDPLAVPGDERRRRGRRKFLQHLPEQFRSPVRITVLLVLVFSALQWMGRRMEGGKAASLMVSENAAWLADRVVPGQAVLSASPWTLAWQTRMTGVWMPQNRTSLENMARAHGASFPWMYFPRQRALPPAPDPVPEFWFDLIRSPNTESDYRTEVSQARREYLRRRLALSYSRP